MSHEILYTSASQGLKPGSRGFCTVVSTAGMAKNLAERLESFSGYRHAFMTHEAQAAQNPVNYAHYHTTIAGRKYHILSRIADAGLDYTQRSNKLAHHVALEPSETANAPGGPAWVMAAKGFFVEQWDGQVRTLPTGREPPDSDRPAQICQRWKQLTGDAGWGGVLAESALRKGGLMSVIFPAGTPVLDLVVESLSLLPPEKRWEVTFSTYFTKAPAGVDCQWRFLLDSTPEATALRRDVRAAVIDLCKTLAQAQGGDLVQAARTNLVSQRGRSRNIAPLQRAAPESPRTAASQPPRNVETDELTLAPPSPPSSARRLSPQPAWLPSREPVRRKRWLLPGIAAGLLLLFFAVVVGAVLCVPRNVPPGQIPAPDPTLSPQQEPPKTPGAAAPTDMSPRQETTVKLKSPKPKRDCPVDEPKVVEDLSLNEGRMARRRPSPFKDIYKRRKKLELPNSMVKDSGALPQPKPNTKQVVLADLYVEDGRDCELRLLGPEFDRRDGQENCIAAHTDEKGLRYWEVTTERKTTLNETVSTPIATFALVDGKLRFNWAPKRPLSVTEPALLRFAFCSLQITAYGKSDVCTFETFEFESKMMDSVRLTNEPEAPIKLVAKGQYPLRSNDDVILDLKFRGIEEVKFSASSRLTMKEPRTTLSIPLPSSCPNASDTKVYFELNLEGKPTDGLSIKTKLGARSSRLSQTKTLRGGAGDSPMWKPVPVDTDLTEKGIEALRSMGEKERDAFVRFSNAQARNEEKRKQASDNQMLAPTETTGEKPPRSVFPSAVKGKSKSIPEASVEGSMGARPDGQPLPVQPNGYEPPWDVRAMNQRKQLDDFLIWCEAMRNLRKDFIEKGSLDYRLYLRAEGREIDLVRTRGFVDASTTGNEKK